MNRVAVLGLWATGGCLAMVDNPVLEEQAGAIEPAASVAAVCGLDDGFYFWEAFKQWTRVMPNAAGGVTHCAVESVTLGGQTYTGSQIVGAIIENPNAVITYGRCISVPATTCEIATGGGIAYTCAWYGLAGIAVGEGCYAAYLAGQLTYETYNYCVANLEACAIAVVAHPISTCNVPCPAGTYCSPYSGNYCWDQSQLGEGCGWSSGSGEVPIPGACAQGECLQNANGGYSCQRREGGRGR